MESIDMFRTGIVIFFIIVLALVFIIIKKYGKNEKNIDISSSSKPLSRKKVVTNKVVTFILVAVIIFIVISFIFDFTDKVFSYIPIALIIGAGLGIIDNFSSANELKKYILNSFTKKYGNVELIKNPKMEIIEGKASTLGCKRKKYYLNINIPKYNCNTKHYYIQKLINDSRYIGDDYQNDYKYKNIKRVIDYVYSADKNVCVLLKQPENLQKLMNALTEKQIINIDVSDNSIVFSKEVNLNNYLEDAIENDVEDVYVFFQEIDKLIKEEGVNYASKI